MPSSELLRRYGYVTPEHHRYDIAELPWKLVRTALGEELELSKEVTEEMEVCILTSCTSAIIANKHQGRG